MLLTSVDRFDVYTKVAEQVTISQAMLMNKDQAAVEIDRILTDCITRVRFAICQLDSKIELSPGSTSLPVIPERHGI